MATTTTADTKKKSSQEAIEEFWKSNLVTLKTTPKAPSILPKNVYEQLVERNIQSGPVHGRPVSASYEEAVRECEAKVAQIVAECKQTNTKYTDPYFDLDDMEFCLDMLEVPPPPIVYDPVPAADNPAEELGSKLAENPGRMGAPNSKKPADNAEKRGLSNSKKPSQMSAAKGGRRGLQSRLDEGGPACAKRIGDIFDDPHFYVAGANIADIRQGSEGDCWFLSSLGSLCVEPDSKNSLIEKICPEKARDEMCGVYGFVFNRDGEWISEVVDDKLYLKAPDYDDGDYWRRSVWDQARFRAEPDVSREEYRTTFQSNSDALWFGSCADPNETWVPLIEKAFAKAHGDYTSISGGWPGEGLEDLTGGITSKIESADILDKDKLWNEGFMKVTKEFLFGVGTKSYAYWDPDRQGIQDTHAYSVLRAMEYKGHRLLQIKNPWGFSEWNGPWSDGSKEWTPEAMQTLNHTFGNEGIFWMTYRDFLRRYHQIWQTRLFGPEWTVSQYWTTINVPWMGDYNDCNFEFSIPKATRAVVALSQLDERYWRGLSGQYEFKLAFRLHKLGETVHIVRGFTSGDRSATAEADLEEGTYRVFLQISGTRYPSISKTEEIVKVNWLDRREKLLRVGLSHDLAHAKGRIPEPKTKPVAKSETKQESTRTEESKTAEKKDEPKADKVDGDKQEEKKEGIKDEVEPEDAKGADKKEESKSTDSTKDEKAKSDATTEKKDSSEGGASVADPNVTIKVTVEAPKEEEPTKSEDAWDATCVVGLRVFCHDTSATIKVNRPEPVDVVSAENKLDIDDPEKDALTKKSVSKVEVTINGEEKKESKTEETKIDVTSASAVTDGETKDVAIQSEPKSEQEPEPKPSIATDEAKAEATTEAQGEEKKAADPEEAKTDETNSEKKDVALEETAANEVEVKATSNADDEATPSVDSSGTEGAKFTPDSSGSEKTESPTEAK